MFVAKTKNAVLWYHEDYPQTPSFTLPTNS